MRLSWQVVVGGLAGLVAAVVVGIAATGGLPQLGLASPVLEFVASLPPVALLAVVAAVAMIPVLIQRWPYALATFFTWLMVEDLIRKLAGNDLRVYFIKDLWFAITVMALILACRGTTPWRNATGAARWTLYTLVMWAIVLAVPTGLEDIRLPLVGLRLDFMYVPLVAAGFLIAQDRERLQRWLIGLAALGGLASAVGIVQAFIGPGFLSPGVAVPQLENLVLMRGTELSGPVFRPTGTFVDPGRFNMMTLTALAIALAAFLITRGWQRRLAAAAAASALIGTWVSGGRTAILVTMLLGGLAATAAPFAFRRPALGRVLQVLAVGAVVLGGFSVLAPGMFESRLDWYADTLDPRSSQFQVASRFDSAATNTVRGIQIGGVLGTGTGRQSLGRQYLYTQGERPELASSLVEGGYGAVAVEWGIVGLALWLAWSGAWLWRQWRATRLARGHPEAGAGLVVMGWMLFFLVFGFFAGGQGFQNYLANAYFWLLSGVMFALPVVAGERPPTMPVAERT